MRYNSNEQPIREPQTGKKIGGKCKVKIKTEYGTARCTGSWYPTSGGSLVCKPCDEMVMPGKTKGPSGGGVGGSTQAYSRFVGGRQRLIPTDRGGRGQTLWFNQAGTPQTVDAGMSVSQYVMGLVGVGVLFFVIGYGYKKGVEKA
tara:strand:- start:9360 stop:9794 length:435 start_codon:yes stop_codon:yes gene_type:complete